MGGYTTQRWPEEGGAPESRAAGASPADDGSAAASAAGWRAQVGGLHAGVDARLRGALADALLLLEPVRSPLARACSAIALRHSSNVQLC